MKELEMILAAVAQLGEAGKEAFIWWLVIDKGLSFVSMMTFFVLAFYTAKVAINNLGSTGRMKQLRDALGIGCRGFLTDSEADAVVEEVLRLKAKERK